MNKKNKEIPIRKGDIITRGKVLNNIPILSASISIKFIFSPSPFVFGVKLLLFNILSKTKAVIPFVIFSFNKALLNSNWWKKKERNIFIIRNPATASIALSLKFSI